MRKTILSFITLITLITIVSSQQQIKLNSITIEGYEDADFYGNSTLQLFVKTLNTTENLVDVHRVFINSENSLKSITKRKSVGVYRIDIELPIIQLEQEYNITIFAQDGPKIVNQTITIQVLPPKNQEKYFEDERLQKIAEKLDKFLDHLEANRNGYLIGLCVLIFILVVFQFMRNSRRDKIFFEKFLPS